MMQKKYEIIVFTILSQVEAPRFYQMMSLGSGALSNLHRLVLE